MSQKALRKKRREHSRTFACLLCPRDEETSGQPEYAERGAYAAHVSAEHPELLDAEGRLLAVRRSRLHLDGEGFYSNVYELVKPDGPPFAVETESGPRGR